MTNKRYVKGYTLERNVKNYYEKLGWLACRASGSHGLFDVWATDGTCLHLIQCKAGGDQKYAERVMEEIKRGLPVHVNFTEYNVAIKIVVGMRKGEPVVSALWIP